jgi:hypothetical protein
MGTSLRRLCGLLAVLAFAPLASGCGGGGGGGDGPPPVPVSVLVVHGSDPYSVDYVAKLVASGSFTTVSTWDGGTSTPALTDLTAHQTVLVSSNGPFADPAALGDNLADYVDAGGGVVLTAFTLGTGTFGGRFLADDYFAIPPGGVDSGGGPTLVKEISSHPILRHVSSFDGGTSSYRPASTTVVDASATLVASWSDGAPLAATRLVGPASTRRADVGLYPATTDIRSDFLVASTDAFQVVVNALLWVGGSL